MMNNDQQQQQMQGFELEEAIFTTAPIGLHCVDSAGRILWANPMFNNTLGYNNNNRITVGKYVSNFVYSNKQQSTTAANITAATVDRVPNMINRTSPHFNSLATTDAVRPPSALSGLSVGGEPQQQEVNTGGGINMLTADDKTLYQELIKRVISGNGISEIPVRFVKSSGTIIHLILDCDGTAIRCQGSSSTTTNQQQQQQNQQPQYYYRFFTRDDTPRRIQEMRSNVLFQETNRSLQMLDIFMNRSMQQMRAPLSLMENACNLVTENIEDIEEVIRRNAAHQNNMSRTQSNGSLVEGGATGRESEVSGSSTPNTSNPMIGNHLSSSTTPLAVALSATLEARSVVGLATTLTKDALALVDDITDLCRFDQGRALLIEKEAVKVRDICLESLVKVPIPIVGSGGLVDVILDIQEGSPSRCMTDRSVLQRCLALLLNFAVDAASSAVSSNTALSAGGSQQRGMVILSVQDATIGQPQGTGCKISVFYTNPPDPPDPSSQGMNIMGSLGLSGRLERNRSIGDATAFASAYTSDSGKTEQSLHKSDNCNVGNVATQRKLANFLAGCCNNPMINCDETTCTLGGSSLIRRMRLREGIGEGVTSCRRDKLGLGLSLLYHLVGAQGSDLRYEIVSEPSTLGGQLTMTKFWFVLPMSLDFPDRLSSEYIVKDDLQRSQNEQQILSAIPSLIRAPPIQEYHEIQQPQQKRARLSSPTHQQQHPILQQPMNDTVDANSAGRSLAGNQRVSCNVAAESSATATSSSVGNKTINGARPLVLVVDDTDVSASLLCMHLRKLNCSSHRAENGEVAIEMIRSAPSPNMYSLILMDLRMPVVDGGFEATATIKGFASNIPVVALTGETSEKNRQRCREIGFDEYKTKPLKRPQLKELLIKLVPGYSCDETE